MTSKPGIFLTGVEGDYGFLLDPLLIVTYFIDFFFLSLYLFTFLFSSFCNFLPLVSF